MSATIRPFTLHAEPPCECGCCCFELVRLDSWEDRATIRCLKCNAVIDTPIGYRVMVTANG